MVQTIASVEEVFNILRTALRVLHGRHVYDMFSLYAQELQTDMDDLLRHQIIAPDFKPNRFNELILPDFSKSNTRRMRYMWDYFIFIYMSHKIQNIKRRNSLNMPTLMYLRGSDYEFTMPRRGAALSASTTLDMTFQISVVHKLKGEFNVLKALSPADLIWIMADIGPYLMARGNTLYSVAEFARIRDEGVFLKATNWKQTILRLFPSVSVFLIYVSNRSNGLKYELESLLDQNLEAHAVLILDDERSARRRSFYDVQDDLLASGNRLLFSVVRDACDVDDVDGFERLLKRFPFRLEFPRDGRDVTEYVRPLVESARRETTHQLSEIPFEFAVPLNVDDETRLGELRRFVALQINESYEAACVSNWPALLLFIEMDIFLNLVLGNVCDAGVSTARYAALTDFAAEFLKLTRVDRFREIGATSKQHANIAMEAALDALSCGEWNDYSDRRSMSRTIVDRIALETNSLGFKSVHGCGKVVMQISQHLDGESEKTADYVGLLRQVLDSVRDKQGEP